MVGFDQSRSMGEAAASTALSNYKNTIVNMKRLIGLAYDDPRAQAEMKKASYTCVPYPHPGDNAPAGIAVQVEYAGETKILPIEAVAGMMVKHMGTIAAEKVASESSALGGGSRDVNEYFPRDWVVGIPVYYTDAQRRAFLAGCEMAGVKGIQRLMNEPTAVALAYGIFKDIRKEFTVDKPTHVMFIDMGSTSYSVTIVDFQPGKLVVKSSQYDADLGGQSFDTVIAEWICTKFEEKYKGKLSGNPRNNPKVMLKLYAAAEKAKQTLSPVGVNEARINLESLMDDFDFSISLMAEEYKTMCAPLLARLAGPIERALSEAKLKSGELTSIEIVGGATRVGSVKETLSKLLGLDMNAVNNGLSTTMNADEAVARGCALQSAILSPRFKVLPYEVIEYQPFPIKIEWDGSASAAHAEVGMEVEGGGAEEAQPTSTSSSSTNSVVMFERGCNFPIVRRVTLKRSGKFTVDARYNDEDAMGVGANNKGIATFHIQAPTNAECKVRVNVKLDIHGSLSLSSAQMVEEIIEKELEEGVEAKADEDGGEAKVTVDSNMVKKPKLKKTSLIFTTVRPLDWTEAELQKEIEVEVAMTNADRVVRETSDARNELESYIYDMRDKIVSESQLAPYCTENEKSTFPTMLETYENWLYEEGFDANKSVYVKKLDELKKVGNAIENRQYEARTRPNAMSTLQKTVEKFTSWLNTSAGDENYDHITEEERATCSDKTDKASAWMYDMLDKQGGLAACVDPVVTVDQIYSKNKELNDVVSPIMHKPKPMPKAEEKKQEEQQATEEQKKEEGGATSEPMDTSEPMEEAS
jgi:heat shock protein 4